MQPSAGQIETSPGEITTSRGEVAGSGTYTANYEIETKTSPTRVAPPAGPPPTEKPLKRLSGLLGRAGGEDLERKIPNPNPNPNPHPHPNPNPNPNQVRISSARSPRSSSTTRPR